MPPPLAAFADALVLTGPTGSGKSAVALELARQLDAEIIALDSMTLYRGMDIGTAKPSANQRAAVPHHLIDVLHPWESGSVAWWLERTAEACADIRARGRRPMFVGGTPFYLKALLHGLFESPPVPPNVRAKWETEAERIGAAALHAELAKVDPKAATKLHPNDVRRVVRALEVFDATGTPLSALQTSWDTPAVPLPTVVLDWPRDELYRRIDARVLAMLDDGWLAEARTLLALPLPLSQEARQALGYKELLAWVGGPTSHDRQEADSGPSGGASTLARGEKQGSNAPRSPVAEPDWPATVVAIQTRTRQFAKRQLTWFRALPAVRWVPANAPNLADRVREAWAEDST